MTTSYRHGSIVGPVLLIGFGAVLLLDNLEIGRASCRERV